MKHALSACVVIGLLFISLSSVFATSPSPPGDETGTVTDPPVTPPVSEDVPGDQPGTGTTSDPSSPPDEQSIFSCGNDICESGESPKTCPIDCGSCGNGVCNAGNGETEATCPQDCTPATYCGDSICQSSESPLSCPTDCGTCGNNVCDGSESCSSCSVDCGTCSNGGSGSGSSGGGGSGGAGREYCRETWDCGEWSPCSGGSRVRICSDRYDCGTTVLKPVEEESCGPGESTQTLSESQPAAPKEEGTAEPPIDQTQDTQQAVVPDNGETQGNGPAVTGQFTGGASNALWFLIAVAVVGVIGVIGFRRRMKAAPTKTQ